MGVAVQFNYANWIAMFPEFTSPPGPSQALVENQYVSIAETLLVNNGSGPVSTAQIQTTLLNTLVAHVAALFFGVPTFSGGAWTFSNSPLVGRITNATQGSVSVGVDMPSNPSSAWFNQTKYGALYWQMIAPYRTYRYIPVTGNRNPAVQAAPPFPFGPGYGRRW